MEQAEQLRGACGVGGALVARCRLCARRAVPAGITDHRHPGGTDHLVRGKIQRHVVASELPVKLPWGSKGCVAQPLRSYTAMRGYQCAQS